MLFFRTLSQTQVRVQTQVGKGEMTLCKIKRKREKNICKKEGKNLSVGSVALCCGQETNYFKPLVLLHIHQWFNPPFRFVTGSNDIAPTFLALL